MYGKHTAAFLLVCDKRYLPLRRNPQVFKVILFYYFFANRNLTETLLVWGNQVFGSFPLFLYYHQLDLFYILWELGSLHSFGTLLGYMSESKESPSLGAKTFCALDSLLVRNSCSCGKSSGSQFGREMRSKCIPLISSNMLNVHKYLTNR